MEGETAQAGNRQLAPTMWATSVKEQQNTLQLSTFPTRSPTNEVRGGLPVRHETALLSLSLSDSLCGATTDDQSEPELGDQC